MSHGELVLLLCFYFFKIQIPLCVLVLGHNREFTKMHLKVIKSKMTLGIVYNNNCLGCWYHIKNYYYHYCLVFKCV